MIIVCFLLIVKIGEGYFCLINIVLFFFEGSLKYFIVLFIFFYDCI